MLLSASVWALAAFASLGPGLEGVTARMLQLLHVRTCSAMWAVPRRELQVSCLLPCVDSVVALALRFLCSGGNRRKAAVARNWQTLVLRTRCSPSFCGSTACFFFRLCPWPWGCCSDVVSGSLPLPPLRVSLLLSLLD